MISIFFKKIILEGLLMNTININITLDELSWLSKGLGLVEEQEKKHDATMDMGLSKQAESPHYESDVAENAQIVTERDELLSNLHTKLIRATRELASQ